MIENSLTSIETQDLLQAAQAELETARWRLGESVAVGDDSSAEKTRIKMAALEQRIVDLEAALPVAQDLDDARQEELRYEAERARLAAQNELREAHLAACRNVDQALALLGTAYDELAATDRNVGGHGKETSRCIRAREILLRAAIHAASPALARDLRIQRPRASSDIRPLAEHEAMMITEHNDVD